MKLFVPFVSMTNLSTQWCHFSQLLWNILCSTDSVTDHDNPVVKSIVIFKIPKYNVPTYKKHANECNVQNNILRHFSSRKTLKFATKSHHEKLRYSFQMPCDIANEHMKKQEFLPLMGVTTWYESEE